MLSNRATRSDGPSGLLLGAGRKLKPWPTSSRASTLDPLSKDRYRTFLATKIKQPEPTQADELRAPALADAFYELASTWLRTNTRDAKKSFQILFNENCAYGFRCNLLGVKWPALSLNALVVVICGAVLWWAWPLNMGRDVAKHVVVVLIICSRALLSSWCQEAERHSGGLAHMPRADPFDRGLSKDDGPLDPFCHDHILRPQQTMADTAKSLIAKAWKKTGARKLRRGTVAIYAGHSIILNDRITSVAFQNHLELYDEFVAWLIEVATTLMYDHPARTTEYYAYSHLASAVCSLALSVRHAACTGHDISAKNSVTIFGGVFSRSGVADRTPGITG